MRVKAKVDFSKKLREWDGFGVNYVETCDTRNYATQPQDYGGFSILSESDRQKIIEMIFGDDGLKPGVIKMFLDPFHQDSPGSGYLDPADIDLSDYDHVTSTKWMRYFARQGLAKIRARKGSLELITTLYGPPGWMTKQKILRGRDLDPAHKIDCAKYMISWAKFLREHERLPVKYLSLHNEGEDYFRWTDEGITEWEKGHDYNLYWPAEQVVDFLKFMRGMLNSQEMQDVGLTPGETSNWYRLGEWGYADAIADDPNAMKNLDLITSHGFGGAVSLGNDILRCRNRHLHSWLTSMSWGRMDVNFVDHIRQHIYITKVNSITPWAVIQRPSERLGKTFFAWSSFLFYGAAFRVCEDGSFSTEPGYFFYKQVCRAGQPGMAVARVVSTDREVGLIGFSSNGTGNPDALVVLNLSAYGKSLDISILGGTSKSYSAYYTSEEVISDKRLGDFSVVNGQVLYDAPPRSVTTFSAN